MPKIRCMPRRFYRQNQCLHFLIDPGFQGVNGLFVLSFEDKA